jgi:Leucine-rich repeat (LRR) protein
MLDATTITTFVSGRICVRSSVLHADLRWSGAITLNLACNEIEEMEGHDLPESTEELFMQGNYLKTVPDSIQLLSRLRHVCFGANCLKDISSIFLCPNLVHLSVCYNELESLRPRRCHVRATNEAASGKCSLMSFVNLHSEDFLSGMAFLYYLWYQAWKCSIFYYFALTGKPNILQI